LIFQVGMVFIAPAAGGGFQRLAKFQSTLSDFD
jgi:hypothetical protein